MSLNCFSADTCFSTHDHRLGYKFLLTNLHDEYKTFIIFFPQADKGWIRVQAYKGWIRILADKGCTQVAEPVSLQPNDMTAAADYLLITHSGRP